MKNCRNCKWARWSKTSNGRRQFGYYASCGYPVTIPLPASRRFELKQLNEKISVAEYRDVPVDCQTWESSK